MEQPKGWHPGSLALTEEQQLASAVHHDLDVVVAGNDVSKS